jgi:tight adherence protein C
MIAIALLGAGIGLGLLITGIGMWPSRPSLGSSLAPLRGGAAAALGAPQPPSGWRSEVGRNVADLLSLLGMRFGSLAPDLAITGKTIEWLCAEKLLGVVGMLLVVPASTALLGLVGFSLPWQLVIGAMLLLAALAFFLPDQNLREEAAKRRRSFRHATSAYLDLVAISLAGGAAAEEALRAALAHGEGWAFERLRNALRDAQLAGSSPWEALGRLGTELNVRELVELASSVSLAGTEGATIRRSLVEKAASSRSHQLAEAETESASATDRMILPLVVLLLGFIVFILYPSLTRVLTAL